MEKKKWFYPEQIEEVPPLLEQGAALHAGGTALLRRSINPERAFIDLQGIAALKEVRTETPLSLGPMLTYFEAAEIVEKLPDYALLQRALETAAATTLRNRITLGGAVCDAPPWSDLMVPLLLAETELALLGKREESRSLSRYLTVPADRKETLITRLILRKPVPGELYFRMVRTHFDYPLFTLGICRNGPEEAPFHLAVYGCRGRFFNDYAAGPAELQQKAEEVSFPARGGFSPEYLRERFRTELKRLTARIDQAE